MRAGRTVVAAAAAAFVACSHYALDPNGLPCSAGSCVDGYVCHPESDRCVPELFIDCTDPRGICPMATGTGDPCPAEGSFLPCSDTATACEAGCRTCGGDLTWSECSNGCLLRTPESCASCADDCTLVIQHAAPICDASGPVCDYAACDAGWVDRDGSRANGCECGPVAAESCDGVDNDCAGGVDDTFTCALGATRPCDVGAGPNSGIERCVTGCAWGPCEGDAPPEAVSDLVASPSDSEVMLTWTYPPDTDLGSCVIVRRTDRAPDNQSDGAVVYTANVDFTESGTEDTWLDTGLTNGQVYYYGIFCGDAAGHFRPGAVPGNNAWAVPMAVACSGIVVRSVASAALDSPRDVAKVMIETAGTARAVVVAVALRQDDAQTGSDGELGSGVASTIKLTRLVTATERGSVRVELWYAAAPPVGTHEARIVFSDSARAVISAVALECVDQTAPIDVFDNNSGRSSSPQVSVAPTVGGTMILDAVGFRVTGGNTPTALSGGGQTLLWQANGDSGIAAQDVRGRGSFIALAPPTPTTMRWTLSSVVDWATVAVAIAPRP